MIKGFEKGICLGFGVCLLLPLTASAQCAGGATVQLAAPPSCWEMLDDGQWNTSFAWQAAKERISDCILSEKAICEEGNGQFSTSGEIEIMPISYLPNRNSIIMKYKFLLSQTYLCSNYWPCLDSPIPEAKSR